MARAEDYQAYDEDRFDYGSLPEVQQQEFLFEQIGFHGAPPDPEAHQMFYNLMYNDELSSNERMTIYGEFVEYLWEEYGILFEDVWEWEAFREWYDSQ
jgi:hypothetical protein